MRLYAHEKQNLQMTPNLSLNAASVNRANEVSIDILSRAKATRLEIFSQLTGMFERKSTPHLLPLPPHNP